LFYTKDTQGDAFTVLLNIYSEFLIYVLKKLSIKLHSPY